MYIAESCITTHVRDKCSFALTELIKNFGCLRSIHFPRFYKIVSFACNHIEKGPICIIILLELLEKGSVKSCGPSVTPRQTTEKSSSIYSPSILTPKDQSIFSTLFFSPEWEDIFSLLTFRRGWWIAFNLCSATGWNFSFFWKLVFKIRKQKFGNSSALTL